MMYSIKASKKAFLVTVSIRESCYWLNKKYILIILISIHIGFSSWLMEIKVYEVIG